MRPGKEGYRVAVVGASSLQGKELLNVLEEQSFPVSRLVTFEADEEEPYLPIVDLREGSQASLEGGDLNEGELDFAFMAARPLRPPAFLSSTEALANGERGVRCYVIDMTGQGSEEEGGDQAAAPAKRVLSVPFLDQRFAADRPELSHTPFHVSVHPAVIVISSLLLRLSARFPIERAVAQLFVSASEAGGRGIEELQKQTVNLLSFKKIPHQVFGAQLAFNLLARLGRAGSPHLTALESRLRQQLAEYLGSRAPLPALRLLQAPIFHSLALSLYVETAARVLPEQAAAALQGPRVRVRPALQDAPSPIDVAGSSDILVDGVAADAAQPRGLWLWAVADNLRLAAVNAVDIAESLRRRVRT